jgi:RNA recognition motif-containing protein
MEDSAEQRSRTLFVKGISYGVEKDSLEDAFTAVGPVRNCFIVRTKGETQHKGCGYVQFALREDAAAALKQLQHTVLGGRKIKVRGHRNQRATEIELQIRYDAQPVLCYCTPAFTCRSCSPIADNRSTAAVSKTGTRTT